MVFCSASSGGSSLSYRPFFNEIENGRIKTIDEAKKVLDIVSSEKILDIIQFSIPDLQQRDSGHLIEKILQLMEGDAIHKRLVAILREHGLVSEKFASHFSETKPFSPLYTKVSGRLLKPNITRVTCLDQNSLRDGNNTCGFHSLKNALGAFAVKNQLNPENSSTLFTEKIHFFTIATIVKRRRGITIAGDASIAHLRKAWKAICENRENPFPRNDSIHAWNDSIHAWNEREISFFNSAGDELMITDPDSIDSLTNLKQLAQTPGPCHHAFIVGSLGHWITILYEKDPQENVHWYGFDSISTQTNDFFIVENIQKISEAMTRIDELAPKLYHKSIGFGLEQLASKIGNEEEILLSQKEENLQFLQSATQFMHEIGWLTHPSKDPLIDHFIHTVKILLQFYREKTDDLILLPDIQQEACPLNPFDHALSLFNLCTPNPLKIETFCVYESLEQSQKCTLLRWINALPENERVKQFEQLMQLLENGYLSLIEKMFAQGNSEDNWDLVNRLIKMKVIPFPEDQKECMHSFIERINFNEMSQQINQLREWLSDPARSALRKDIILRLSHELDSHSNPYEVRDLASLLEREIFLFSIAHPESLDQEFQLLIHDAIRFTTDQELANPNNCYHRYKTLEKIRSEQSPSGIPIVYKERGFIFQPPKETVVFHRSAIPQHLNRDRLVAFFDGIEKKMRAKLAFAQNVHAALADNYNETTTYSAEECLKVFLEAKRNFLEDPYVYSLTQLPQDPKAVISTNAFYFYSLLNYWFSLNSTPEENDSLSEQELVILSNAKEIRGCGTGKGEKIKNEYVKLSQSSTILLPHPGLVTQNLRSSEGEKRKERLLSLFTELYKKYGERVLLILHRESFIKDLLGYEESSYIKDPTHLQRYIINRFGILVGAPKGLEFDRFYIDPQIFTVTDDKFLETFFKHAKPLLEEIPQMLEEVLTLVNAALKGNKRSDIVNELGKDDESLFERTIDPDFDWDNGTIGDESIEKVKPEALPDLFSAIGILRAKNPNLKINPSHPLPLKKIIEHINENLPLRTLDFSGCTWLAYDDLRQIIIAAKDLDILNLSDCIQFTNKEMDGILAICGCVNTVDLNRCVQLSELDIPIKSKLTLNGCRINGVVALKLDQEEIKVEIPLGSGQDYSNKKKELANPILIKSPESVSSRLHGLGFTADEAIDFCILHKLENIDLTQFCSSIADEHITKLSNSNYGIKKIAIDSYRITDDAVIQLAGRCNGLTSINLEGCDEITNAGLTALANHCKELTSINLKGCNQINDAGLIALASGCNKLTSINLNECSKITDAGLTALANHCNELTSIKLAFCKLITDTGFTALANHCKGLTSINLHMCGIANNGLTALANHCKELIEINLFGCDTITTAGFTALANLCKELTSIDLSYCHITDTELTALANQCKKLTSINLISCKKITNAGLTALAKQCKGLTSIDLTWCKEISYAGIISLAIHCKGLTSINLSSCGNFNDAGLTALANQCNGLTSINLSLCSKITDAGIIALANQCKGLTSIYLAGCMEITDVGLTAIANQCKGLTLIDLACIGITDTGIIALANHCNELASIDIVACDLITDAGLTALTLSCNKLAFIGLRGSKKISDQTIKTLVKIQPQLKIDK